MNVILVFNLANKSVFKDIELPEGFVPNVGTGIHDNEIELIVHSIEIDINGFHGSPAGPNKPFIFLELKKPGEEPTEDYLEKLKQHGWWMR